MTNGFIVLVEDGKCVKAVYSNGGSYTSELGLLILNIFKQNKFKENFKKILPINLDKKTRKKYYEYDSLDAFLNPEETSKVLPSVPLTKDLIIKNKENIDNFFVCYSYLYDINKDNLKIYYYGELLYTISRIDIDLYKYIFDSEDILWQALSYDEKTCSHKNDFHKEIKKLLKTKPEISDIKNIVDNYDESNLTISEGRISDCWDNHYKKEVKNNKGLIAVFIIGEFYGKYDVSIQLPFIRNRVGFNNLKSARACEKSIIDLVKTKKEKLINFRFLYNCYEEYVRKLRELMDESSSCEYSINSKSIIDDFKNIINDYKKPFLETQSFNKENLISELKDRDYNNYKILKEQESKTAI